MDILEDSIPIPDRSGAANTQQEAIVPAIPVQPESPLSMGLVVTGLASESHGLNRQSSQIVANLYYITLSKLEDSEKELKRLLPMSAVYEERIKGLKSQSKINAFLSLIASALLAFGSAFLTSTQASPIAGGILLMCGVVLSFVIIFTTWSNER